jgi:hypothetical protein
MATWHNQHRLFLKGIIHPDILLLPALRSSRRHLTATRSRIGDKRVDDILLLATSNRCFSYGLGLRILD